MPSIEPYFGNALNMVGKKVCIRLLGSCVLTATELWQHREGTDLAEGHRLSASGFSEQEHRDVLAEVEVRQVDDGRELGGWNEDVGMSLADGDLSKVQCNVRL